MTERTQTEHRLLCVDCAAEAPTSAVGWRALLTVGDEDALYCPRCAEPEFGWP